jgi:Bacterial regulatory helix-turn-helix protein, lysR family
MKITLQQIRYFLALDEERSFSRAAEKCGVRQPSLTGGIKDLETKFGGPLFKRKGTSCELSRLGVLIRPYFLAANRALTDAEIAAVNFVQRELCLRIEGVHVNRKEGKMRKVFLSSAAVIAVFIFAAIAIHAPRPADAVSPYETKILTPFDVESKIDVQALPRYDILSEAEE